jgi:prepilin-type N-terminal cleavage/methylation domain-containing protein
VTQSPVLVPHPNSPRRRRRTAFTLVELLVVIGIIALLISILLPVLSKARESANRTKCLSNIRQIAMGFFSYCNDNKGAFPYMAGGGTQLYEDWIWWTTAAVPNNLGGGGTFFDQLPNHGIAGYLNLQKDPKVMYCPSDDPKNHVRGQPTPYPFSYVLSNLYTSEYKATGGTGLFQNLANNYFKLIVAKLTQVKNTSEKILVFEESEATIDDGNGSLWCVPGQFHYTNLPAWRHDKKNYKDAGTGPTGEFGLQDNGKIPNPDAKGVIGFCDGHADFRDRIYILSKWHNIPDEAMVEGDPAFPSWP